MSSARGSRLVLLVGSNPLPNYLAACALRPGETALVHTNETATAKDRLKSELRRALGETVFVEPDPFVEDATCGTTVRRVVESLLPGDGDRSGGDRTLLLLNYTGGTKVMAAHARMAYSASGGAPERASYLDEGGPGRQPRLRFDDGSSTSLADYPDLSLDLRTILSLHGFKHEERTACAPAPTIEDARQILSGVTRNVALAKKLYDERVLRLADLKKPSAASHAPFSGADYGLVLSLPRLPGSAAMDRKAYERWYKFIGGEWLEEWVGDQVRQLELDPAPEIVVGVNAFRGEKRANLEVDVGVVQGHRSYFISCTTDTTKAVCKSKLFEVAVRSRQLGGDLARGALVCLACDDTVAGLRADIDDVWGARNTTRVFGLSDVSTWSDCGGKQPNRHSLRTWMES